MQTINILRDNGRELSGGFQLRQLAVGCIGKGCKTDHLLPVEIVKLRRVADKKAVAEDGFRWVIKFLIVKAIDRTEIGNAAFGRDTGTAEKDNAMGFINHLLEFLIFSSIKEPPLENNLLKKPPMGGFLRFIAWFFGYSVSDGAFPGCHPAFECKCYPGYA